MNYCAAGEVKHAQFAHPAADTPDPVSYRVINQCRPDQREDHESGKLHPLGKRTCDECRGDDCEHSLKNHECHMRNCRGIIGVGGLTDAFEAQPVQVTDQVVNVRGERQRIAPKYPLKRNKSDDKETLHNRT